MPVHKEDLSPEDIAGRTETALKTQSKSSGKT